MNLLDLPPELRLHIYSYIPFLNSASPDSFLILNFVSGSAETTPSLCRTCSLLRRETLPLYASSIQFVIKTEEWRSASKPALQGDVARDSDAPSTRFDVWLSALEPDENLLRVRSVQFSGHWELDRPVRFQGQVGFYVRLVRDSVVRRLPGAQLQGRPDPNADPWRCVTNTYPINKDSRALRIESVNLLQGTIRAYLEFLAVGPTAGEPNGLVEDEPRNDNPCGLRREDLVFVVAAMNIVASNPISVYDIDQTPTGRQRRREIWTRMESELAKLLEDKGVEAPRTGVFYTPH